MKIQLSALVLAVAVIGSSIDQNRIRIRQTGTVEAPGGGDQHAYFDALAARGDCHTAFSLRPVEGETVAGSGDLADVLNADCAVPDYEFQLEPKSGTAIQKGFRNGSSLNAGETKYRATYTCSTCGSGNAYAADSYPQAQDATKVRIPAYERVLQTLAADINSSTTTITLTGTTGPTWNTGRAIKIDNEYILLTQTDASTGPLLNVTRGAFSSTAAAHTAGATIFTSINAVGTDNYLIVPIRETGPEEATWLFTWDAWHSDDWVGFTGLNPGFKEFQLVNYTDRFFEFQQRFDECGVGGQVGVTHPSCVPDTHIGSAGARLYTNTMTPITTKYPVGPTSNPFLLEHSKWIRYWVYVEQQVESDPANFTNVTTLSASMDGSTTSMPIVHPTDSTFAVGDGPSPGNSVFYGGYIQPNGSAPGRIAKIDNELVEITSCPTTGNPRTCTVIRGRHGTSAASHASGADVGLAFDHITMWMADEDTNPTLVYSNIPAYMPMYESTANQQGVFKEFWFEFDTSSSDAFANRAADNWSDLITYVRNFALLKNPPSDWSALRVKPVGASPPAPTPAPSPLAELWAFVRGWF